MAGLVLLGISAHPAAAQFDADRLPGLGIEMLRQTPPSSQGQRAAPLPHEQQPIRLASSRFAVAQADQNVLTVQRRLAELGYNPGPQDGLMGPRTRAAVEAFQRDQGLAPTGRVDTVLMQTIAQSQPAASSPAAPALPEDDGAMARLLQTIEATAVRFCRDALNTRGWLHERAVEVVANGARHPDLVVYYRGVICEGVDDAPLRLGGFCGRTMEGMKCKTETYSWRDGEYVLVEEGLD